MPSSELESIKKSVEDEDSFTIRLNAICNLIDRINKKQIDKFTDVKTDGSKKTLTNLLKKMFPNEHNLIDDKIDKALGMIFLLRAFHTHQRNINIQKAYAFFGIDNPISDFSISWRIVFTTFNQIFDDILQLFKSKSLANLKKQQEIDEDLQNYLENIYINENRNNFDDIAIRQIILYLLTNERVIDTTLADEFGMDISTLREILLPLIPNTLLVRYHDFDSTQIEIRNHAKMVLKRYYFKE